MYTMRTRFMGEILTEFLPPSRLWKNQSKRVVDYGRVIVLLLGVPGVIYKQPLMEFLARKGFWVFCPRYRGTWESGGRFLKESPEKDVSDILDELSSGSGFTSLWDQKKYKLKPKVTYLVASSFGGVAGILASRDSRVDRVVAFSPVVDWKKLGKKSIMHEMRFVRDAFGGAYRFTDKDWKKLLFGRFYNPVFVAEEIRGEKLLIVHTKDDDVVPWKPTQDFARRVGAKLILLKKGGHMSVSTIMEPRFWKEFLAFIKK